MFWLKKNIKIDQVILYGSYASGHMKLYSDIDIAIISPDFGKDKFTAGQSQNR